MSSSSSSSQNLRQERARTLDSIADWSPPLAPFEHHGKHATLRWAMEPREGAWDDLRAGPPLDLRRLLVRPWRDRPDEVAMPGSILIQGLDSATQHDLNICILNATLAAHLALGEYARTGAVAIDAGCCWIVMPPATSRASFHFLRKDGHASQVELQGQKYFPQDQETSWSIPELEVASSTMWQVCLATAEALSLRWDQNPFMSQAGRAMGAAFDLSVLDASTPQAPKPRTRPRIL